jgi:hypothetical protein
LIDTRRHTSDSLADLRGRPVVASLGATTIVDHDQMDPIRDKAQVYNG